MVLSSHCSIIFSFSHFILKSWTFPRLPTFTMNVNNFIFCFFLCWSTSIFLVPSSERHRKRRDEGNFVSEPKNVAQSSCKKRNASINFSTVSDRFFWFKVTTIHTLVYENKKHSNGLCGWMCIYRVSHNQVQYRGYTIAHLSSSSASSLNETTINQVLTQLKLK